MVRHLICIDKNRGQQLWDVKLDVDYREDSYSGFITEHGYASNTPVSDGEHLWLVE